MLFVCFYVLWFMILCGRNKRASRFWRAFFTALLKFGVLIRL